MEDLLLEGIKKRIVPIPPDRKTNIHLGRVSKQSQGAFRILRPSNNRSQERYLCVIDSIKPLGSFGKKAYFRRKKRSL